MKKVGRVEIPQEAFLAVLKVKRKISKDGGKSWNRQSIDTSSFKRDGIGRWDIRDIVFTDEKTGWAVGRAAVLKTDKFAKQWYRQTKLSGAFEAVKFSSEHFGILIEREPELSLFTSDAGKTWNELDVPPTVQPGSVIYVDQSRNAIWAKPNGEIWVREETKGSWAQSEISHDQWKSLLGSDVYGYPAVNRTFDGKLIAVWNVPELNSGPLIVTSEDNGLKWR
jgi:photosystem II stability/assembly factor-like uncharacterized protein